MNARLPLLSIALLLALGAPSAHAATATITGDGGTQIPLADGLIQRHMSPEIQLAFAEDEARVAVQVIGPSGAPASFGQDCIGTRFAGTERVRYAGNGAYTLVLRISKNPEDTNCAEATEQRIGFAINASTAIVPPDNQPLLTRRPDEISAIEFSVPIDLNPGADGYELRYAANAVLGPDGGITGDAEQGFVDTSTGIAKIRFSRPGRYTLVARARSFGSAGDVFTTWSPRVDINLVAPFDLLSRSFPDSRGPSYKVAGVIRERTATGKVTISIAKGKKGKRFRRLGTAKIRKGGKFSLRFRLKPGSYTLRYSYRGNATVARGTVVDPIKITRRGF